MANRKAWLLIGIAMFLSTLAEARPEESRGYIGVVVGEVPDSLMAHLPSKLDKGGVLVRRVLKGSPAAKAGLVENDIVVSIDGESVGTPEMLMERVRKALSDKPLAFKILRGGEEVELEVKPEIKDKLDRDLLFEEIGARMPFLPDISEFEFTPGKYLPDDIRFSTSGSRNVKVSDGKDTIQVKSSGDRYKVEIERKGEGGDADRVWRIEGTRAEVEAQVKKMLPSDLSEQVLQMLLN